MRLSSPDFAWLRTLVSDRTGMHLDEDKLRFVESRLEPLAATEGVDLGALLARARQRPANGLEHRLVEALVIHETMFFRDAHAFEALGRHVLPDLAAARSSTKALSIWSGACSSGQEAYSLAMLVKTVPALAGHRVTLLASDLSAEALAKARAGVYSKLELSRGTSAALAAPHVRAVGDAFEVLEPIRRLVEFRQLNLSAPWPLLPRMDLVLLRNVLIYFAPAVRRGVYAQLRSLLAPDGLLLLGSGEIPHPEDGFETVRAGKALFFRKR